MTIYSIYKVTNLINSKVYIGFTVNFNKRKKEHLSGSVITNSRSSDNYFHRAIRKYGWSNFRWDIIYQSKDGDHCLNVMENKFILEHNSFTGSRNCWGYNETLGGDGCLGYKHTPEHIEKLRIRFKGKNNPSFGKTWKLSEKQKRHLSQKLTGIKKTKEQIETRVNLVSKTWLLERPDGTQFEQKNLKKFCRENNLNQGAMCKVNQGKQTHHKGWKCIKLSS